VSPRRRRFLDEILRFLVLLGLVFAIPAVVAGASASEIASAAPPNSQFEVNITGNGSATTMGEPEIAQNPRNPNNLYVDWTTFRTRPVGTPVWSTHVAARFRWTAD